MTLPSAGDYELCPVCGWEDDGAEPWISDGPNGISLVEAQQHYLRFGATHKRSRSWVRQPRPDEPREPDWRPYDPDDELIRSRMARERIRVRRMREAMAKQAVDAQLDRAENPFAEFNVRLRELRVRAGKMTLAQVEAQFRETCSRHLDGLGEAEIELFSRLIKDELWPIRHPIDALAWSWRHRGSASWLRRLDQLRRRSVRLAG